MFSFEGKVGITGASDGLGRSCVLAFAERGAVVFAAAGNQAGLAETAALAEQTSPIGEAVDAFPCDVTSESEVRRLVEAAAGFGDGLGFVVNVASTLSMSADAMLAA